MAHLAEIVATKLDGYTHTPICMCACTMHTSLTPEQSSSLFRDTHGTGMASGLSQVAVQSLDIHLHLWELLPDIKVLPQRYYFIVHTCIISCRDRTLNNAGITRLSES